MYAPGPWSKFYMPANMYAPMMPFLSSLFVYYIYTKNVKYKK